MKWMRERDLLIAQTMEFVQSVTGKKPDIDISPAASVTPLALETSKPARPPAPMPDIEALLAMTGAAAGLPKPAPMPKPAPLARPDLREDFQSEIKARVANFRAHQERFSREREAYCSATMAKVHAALKDGEPLPRLGE